MGSIHYTSNLAKLLQWVDRLAMMKHESLFLPITIDLSPTSKCNNDCDFCAVKKRDKTQEISLDLAKQYMKKYKDLGAFGLEFTGGGEPLMHPDILEMIRYGYKLGYKMGLITNGHLMGKLDELLKDKEIPHFEWIRISANWALPDLSRNLKIPEYVRKHIDVIGINIVWTRNSKMSDLELIPKFLEENPFIEYVKITPDCTELDEQFNRIAEVEEFCKTHDKIFSSSKETLIPKACYIGCLKPHIDADGYVYRCATCGLFEGKYSEKFRIGDIANIPVRVDNFDTSGCKFCFFYSQNESLRTLLTDVRHKEFI